MVDININYISPTEARTNLGRDHRIRYWFYSAPKSTRGDTGTRPFDTPILDQYLNLWGTTEVCLPLPKFVVIILPKFVLPELFPCSYRIIILKEMWIKKLVVVVVKVTWFRPRVAMTLSVFQWLTKASHDLVQYLLTHEYLSGPNKWSSLNDVRLFRSYCRNICRLC